MLLRFGVRALWVLGAFAAMVPVAWGQAYPAKPVRVVLGQPPGSILDVTLRLVGARLGQTLGQPVVIENRPGANATIAANMVIKAPPDGHTLWMGTAAGLHPLFNASGAAVLGQDLSPVSIVVAVPFNFYISAKVPAKTIPELVAYSKANPAGKMNFAPIVAQHELLMHLLAARTGITYTTIPFRQGGAPAVATAMRAGDIDIAFAGLAGFEPALAANAVRAVMITTPKRSRGLPDVPTATELGIPNFEAASYSGLAAPMGTPPAIAQRISGDLAGIMKEADIVERFRTLGVDPVGSTPEEQIRVYEGEIRLWTEAAKLSNYKPQ
jgi:tripartite-type tricarboxylate transporter receptor subunit TctC